MRAPAGACAPASPHAYARCERKPLLHRRESDADCTCRIASAQYQPESVEWAPGYEFLRKGRVGDARSTLSEEQLVEWRQHLAEAFPDGLPECFAGALRAGAA